MTQPLAEFTDYETLRRALATIRELRNISLERLDEITGASPYYFAHLLGPRPTRRIGLQSLGWALGGLGIKGVLVTDPVALALVEGRYEARDVAHLKSVRSGATEFRISKREMTKRQAKGRENRWKKMSPAKRARWARKMNRIRWKKARLQGDYVLNKRART
jgi:hypothetical protein